ncbi:MAG TPA: hypothetical protein PL041_04550 [Melioribacteraceae bacterium]|nr:hypothetical protein [Melioribacteraceae bacterium]
MIHEDIKIFLPKYLSEDSTKKLLQELKLFPNNMDKRLYTFSLMKKDNIFQGDGVKNQPVYNILENSTKFTNCLIISNTCDIDIHNKRLFPGNVLYAPLISFTKYSQSLINLNYDKNKINSHLESVKNQEITSIFYLPKLNDELDESLVFLDRIFNVPIKYFYENGSLNNRLFSLSDYGNYLFLFKLSIHFTRLTDKVNRSSVSDIT